MFSMKKTVELTGVSVSTLRYYEEEGLLKNIARDSRGRRIYSEENIEFISLIKCFRSLGISIKSIKEELNNLINKTKIDKIDTRTLLMKHRKFLVEQRENIEISLKEIDKKIKLLNENEAN